MTSGFKVFQCRECGCFCANEKNLFDHIAAFHQKILKEPHLDLLYDFYAHLENCPGVDLHGIWDAIATYKPKE